VHLIQDGGWLWAVVNMVKNHWLPKRCGISWPADWLLTSQEGLFSMELVHFIWFLWFLSQMQLDEALSELEANDFSNLVSRYETLIQRTC
jgi:hypothetical protein